MGGTALVAPARLTVSLRGTRYPVVLPSTRDARLHLAAVIISLQILGQVAFSFRLSITQILVSLVTCALLETAIAFRQQHMLIWPASALLTGNGVAFVLRVDGTRHGDWWSARGWWIFAATAAGGLLSKYVIRIRGRHVFNPSNIGLVVCFLALGSGRVEPLDFWWGPMSAWMALALGIIVLGGLGILLRLGLFLIAASFWLAFAAALAVLAATGHAMVARWHLGAVTGLDFWWVLATSPEILVFLFFMITDPKTTPGGRRARLFYGVSIGLLAAVLVAPARTEFWSKVAVLGALALVCLVRALAGPLTARIALRRRVLVAVAVAAVGIYAAGLYVAGAHARTPVAVAGSGYDGWLPPIRVLPAKGVVGTLDAKTADRIVGDLLGDLSRAERESVEGVALRLEAGAFQSGPTPVARIDEGGGRSRTVELGSRGGRYVITGTRRTEPA